MAIFQGVNGSITINGVEYKGSNIFIEGDSVVIDSVEIEVAKVEAIAQKSMSIVINGDVESIETKSGNVTALSVGSIKTASGDVDCLDVTGSVVTVSGDVDSAHVMGSVTTVSGDISHRIIR